MTPLQKDYKRSEDWIKKTIKSHPPRRPNNEGAMIVAITLGILLLIAMFGWMTAQSHVDDLQRQLADNAAFIASVAATQEAESYR